MLFANLERVDARPKTNRESDYTFLNRSARPEIGRVRDFLVQLCQQYPSDEVGEQIARIQSHDDANFTSAVFELLLYAALKNLGCVLKPHPELPNGSSCRPDFLVQAPGGDEFYLEAVLARPRVQEDAAAEARVGIVIDTLSRASHPNFMVAVETNGYPTTQPSGKRLLRDLLLWLDSLDPDHMLHEAESSSIENLPSFVWSHEEWDVLLRPIPVKVERRGKTSTLVGIMDGYAGIIDDWTPIRDAIKFKGGKYGQLEKPLLVALNFASFNLDRIDEMQALYGQEQFVFPAGAEPQCQRVPNGAWWGKSGPQSTRVSGAWLFNDLTPYTAATRKHTVYVNPWAQNPLPDFLNLLPHAILQGDKIHRSPGATFRELLGLSEGWPE